MGEDRPDRFAFVDGVASGHEGDDLHHADVFRADEGEYFIDARQQHRPHKPCRLTDRRFLRFGLGFGFVYAFVFAFISS